MVTCPTFWDLSNSTNGDILIKHQKSHCTLTLESASSREIVAMCSRIVHLFCSNATEKASLFSHSPVRDFSQVANAFSLFKNATSPVWCTSPFIVLQTCQRHASFTTKMCHLNRPIYILKYRPVYALSALSQMKNLTQSFLCSTNKQRIAWTMLQRSFSSQHGSHKQTGSYSSSSQWERANRTTVTYITVPNQEEQH